MPVLTTCSLVTLSETPVPSTIEVEVSGTPRDSGRTYDSGMNAVIFDSDTPTGGDVVVIAYEVAE